jgi:transcriptional regulator with XRE-family HTH domain
MRRTQGTKSSNIDAGQSSRKNLSINLQVARAILGWSQEELGSNCGLKRTYIGAIERQEVNPGVDNLDRLGAGLGVAVHVLIRDPEQAHALICRSLL